MERTDKRVAVLGAGALGLTSAYRLARHGYRVTVIEEDKVVGGLAAGFMVGGNYLDRFYHHIFRSDQHVIKLIDELGLSRRLFWLKPQTAVLNRGKRYRLDSPLAVLRFSPIPLADRLRMGMALAALKLTPAHRPLESITADAWLRRWMGKAAYEAVWRPQLEAKFGDRYAEISMAWMWARVHDRTPSLGYLHGGFQLLYNRLGEEIERLGGEIRLGEAVTALRRVASGIEVGSTRGAEVFSNVVSTLPTRVSLQLSEGMSEAFSRQFGRGDAFGAQCLILALDRQLMTDGTYWLSVTDPGYPFMAAVEHTNMMPISDYGNRHLLYLGNYMPMSSDLAKMDRQQLLDEFLPYLRGLNGSFKPEWVTESWLFRAPFAQPIVTRDFPRHIAPIRSPWRNLYLASMFQVYPHDRGQNYSVELGNRVAEMLVADDARGAAATG